MHPDKLFLHDKQNLIVLITQPYQRHLTHLVIINILIIKNIFIKRTIHKYMCPMRCLQKYLHKLIKGYLYKKLVVENEES